MSIPPEPAAILLSDLDRSVAPSHIPGKWQSLEDGQLIVPHSGGGVTSVQLGSDVIERF